MLRDIRLDLSPVAAQIGDSVKQGAAQAEAALDDVGDAADRAGEALEDAADTAADAFREIDAAAEAAYRKIEDDAREMAAQQERLFDELEEAAEEAFSSIGDDGETAGEKVGDGLKDGTEKAKKSLKELRDEAVRDFNQVQFQIEQVEAELRELSREFARTGDQDIFVKIRDNKAVLSNLRGVREELRKVADEADGAAKKSKRFFDDSAEGGRGLRRVLGTVAESFVSIGSAVVGLGASAPTPAGIIALGGALLGLAAAIPVVIGLGAAIADLAGLVVVLPAGISVLVAALAPLKIAFIGVSDAIQAVLDGDPEKITEALKGLSPSARSVVREFQALLPSLRGVKTAIQEAFFSQTRGELTRLARALLPSVSKGLQGIAGELGVIVREFAQMFRTPQGIAFINRVLAVTQRILDGAANGVQGLVDVFFKLGDTGLGVVEKLGELLFKSAEDLAEFVDKAQETGALDRFLNEALATLRELWGLVKAVGNLIAALFSRGDDEGRSFIATLTEMTNQLAEFFRSAEGQEFLQDMVDLLPEVAAALGLVFTSLQVSAQMISTYIDFVKTMIGFWSEVISVAKDVGSAIGSAFATAWDAVSNFFVAVGEWFAALPGHIAGFFSMIGSAIADAFVTAWDAVVSFFTAVVEFIASLPGRVVDAIVAFGDAVVNGIKTAFDLALQAIGVAIGLILFNIFVLPGLIIDGLQALPGLLAAFFTSAWQTVVDVTTTAFNAVVTFAVELPGRIGAALVALYEIVTGAFSRAWNAARDFTVSAANATVSFVTSLPGRIGAALAALYGIITGAFSRALSAGRSIVVSGFNSIVSFVTSVPGRLSGLAGRFLSAGRSLMTGFFNGLKAAGGLAGDVGAAIYRSIKGFLNSAIGSINAGIGKVDAVLPGSLPRIPQLATGGMTLGPTLAALSETGRREVVLPVEDPRTMAALRDALGIGRPNGPQVVFEAGAIQVTFSGVVPTEEEAYRAGAAVAQGIGATLARSDVTTRIRTM